MICFKIPVEDTVAMEQVEGFLYEYPEEPWSIMRRPEGVPLLQGYFENHAAGEASLARLREVVPELDNPEKLSLPDEDWKHAYRHHLKVCRFGRLVWVPVWERDAFEPEPDDALVALDSGMAFGTGSHETTRLCARFLVAFTQNRKPGPCRVVDAGSGSGILALSAARLGFGEVRGFDNDPDAVAVSRENAAMNDLGAIVPFETADLDSGLGDTPVDVLLANIETHVLRDHALDLLRTVAPGGWLIMSGILARDRDELERHFLRAARLQWPEGAELNAENDGEWSGLVLRRQR